MENVPTSPVSSAPTDDDKRKRDIVAKLMNSENKILVDFAKHLVTVSFPAIGVVLALEDKWLGPDASAQLKLALAFALALFLVAALLATLAAGVYRHRVTLSDYGDIDNELHRIAKRRHWLTAVGFGLLVFATIGDQDPYHVGFDIKRNPQANVSKKTITANRVSLMERNLDAEGHSVPNEFRAVGRPTCPGQSQYPWRSGLSIPERQPAIGCNCA